MMPDQPLALLCDGCGNAPHADITPAALAFTVDLPHVLCSRGGRWRAARCDACYEPPPGPVTAGSPHEGCQHTPAGGWFPVEIEDLEEHGPEIAGPGYFTEEEAPFPEPYDSFPTQGPSLEPHMSQFPPSSGVCSSCGCTDLQPCPGGCLWANARATLCSRCVLTGAGHV